MTGAAVRIVEPSIPSAPAPAATRCSVYGRESAIQPGEVERAEVEVIDYVFPSGFGIVALWASLCAEVCAGFGLTPLAEASEIGVKLFHEQGRGTGKPQKSEGLCGIVVYPQAETLPPVRRQVTLELGPSGLPGAGNLLEPELLLALVEPAAHEARHHLRLRVAAQPTVLAPRLLRELGDRNPGIPVPRRAG
ncbi:MAG: hypothetical protein AVDCRST_MAG78-2799 [uncultured Rubrobacteraceae bacterium]|uniref:Uncharacterized protein n=1 Tax=uncultured Rubrobacteraceae bacterium TaxID=349277 RepID=A0A6J4QNQ8_9ACTN|nr:MAG: hypothetical protein AVDCRST_MAG78-2799 [uncultured Rubrobacteraceae bacterium]